MIPDFQTVFLPLLRFLGDKKFKTTRQIKEEIIREFNITPQEQTEKIPSKRAYLYANRIGWALTYLKRADLIASPERASYVITDSGLDVLRTSPQKINVSFLKKFDAFNQSHLSENEEETTPLGNISDEKTPDEIIDIGYKKLRNNIKSQIFDQIRENDSVFFEKLVLDLLLKMGYGGSDKDMGSLTSRGADEGIDGIIKEDRLGLDKIYIQAKKWKDSVGRPEIQKFVGALQGQKAKKGIFITLSTFSKDALEYADKLDISIVLIDGEKLTDYMLDYELGVNVKDIYKTFSLDTDYFIED